MQVYLPDLLHRSERHIAPMTRRHILCSLLLASLALLLLGCAGDNRSFNSLQLSPGSASLASPGSTVQFTATAIYNQGFQVGFPKNVSGQVTWASSNPAVATVSASGVATAVNAGSTTITATMQVNGGPATANAALNVASGPRALNSISIIPANNIQTVYANGQTSQFIAIGAFNASPTTQDVTNQVTWTSSDVDVAVINSTGLATAISCAIQSGCQTVMTASFNDPTSGLITATSNLTTINDPNIAPLPSLTVYEVGQGTGTVVSNPVGINCSSGGTTASCTANFPITDTVTLTATPTQGTTSVFLGWSSNCNGGVNLNLKTCTVPMANNQTVGAIFALNPTP